MTLMLLPRPYRPEGDAGLTGLNRDNGALIVVVNGGAAGMTGPEQGGFSDTEDIGQGLTGRILLDSGTWDPRLGTAAAFAAIQQHRQGHQRETNRHRSAHQPGAPDPETDGEQAPGPELP